MIRLKQILLVVLFSFLINYLTQASAQIPQSLPGRNPFLPEPYLHKTTTNNFTELPETISTHPKQSFQIYKLSYVKASEIKEALQTILQNGKIGIDHRSNSILFWGTPEDAIHVQKALNTIDVPSSQITIEAKVISINKENSKNLGINWNWDSIPQNLQAGENNNKTSGGHFRFWHNYSFNFSATLNALLSSGKAKLLASPHIITQPGKEGKIFIGDHIPYQIEKHDNSGNYSTTEYIDAGITLKCTPIVNKDENILTAEVSTEISTPTLVAELKNYRVTSRKAETTISMKSGETLVIGGLITEEEQKAVQKIPLLGDLPLLGVLFKNKTFKHNKTEILILLTPYITKAGEAPVLYKERIKFLEAK